MTAHTRMDGGARARRRGLVELGWPHFWLLSGILAGALALVVLVLFVYISEL